MEETALLRRGAPRQVDLGWTTVDQHDVADNAYSLGVQTGKLRARVTANGCALNEW